MGKVTLRTIITDTVVTLLPHETVAEALRVMEERQVSSLIVIDEAQRPIGIYTEHDSLKLVCGEMALETPVSHLMSRTPLTCRDDEDIHDAYLKMAEHGYRHLVVVDREGGIAGLVTQGDFLRYMGFDRILKVKTVDDVMTKSIVTVAETTAVARTAALMAEHLCDYAVVVRETIPVGLVTERDINRRLGAGTMRPEEMICDLCRPGFLSVQRTASLLEAASLMEGHDTHQILIVDDTGSLAGVLTRHDVLQAIHGSHFEFLLRQLDRKKTRLAVLDRLHRQLVAENAKLEHSEERFRRLFDLIPDGVVVIDAQTRQPLMFNEVACRQLGYTRDEFRSVTIARYEALEDAAEQDRHIRQVRETGQDTFETVHLRKDGSRMDVRVTVLWLEMDGRNALMAHYRDITTQKRRETRLNAQLKLLETVADNRPMEGLLQEIVRFAEEQSGAGIVCSVLLVDASGQKLRHGAALRLPDAYCAAVDGLPIAEGCGSCGTAAARCAPVIVEDVATDPLWSSFSDVIAPYGWLRACWSMPFFDSDKNLLGTFGFYADTPRGPTADERELIAYTASLAGLVVERFRRQENFGKQALFLHTLVDTIPDLIWLKDPDGVYLACNPRFEKLYGAPESFIVGKTDDDFVDRETAEFFRRNDRLAIEGDTARINEETLTFRDGGYVGEFETYKVPMKDDQGKLIGVLGIARDITERKAHEEALRRHDADLNRAQALAHIGSWILDLRRNVLKWSDECYRIFGVPIGASLSYDLFLERVHPEDREKVDAAWQQALAGHPYTVEHRIVVNGELKWVREHAELELDADGGLIAGVGTAQDITERKNYEARLEYMSNYDPLTGLANRALIQSHLRRSVEQTRRHKTVTALLMFDLDRFKDVNDSFGHSAGDELLTLAASRFAVRLREEDMVSRLGGDEFAVVLENLARPEDAARIVEEMIELFNESFRLSNGVEVHIGMSAGIALSPQHGEDVEELMQHADAALYRAKTEGRNTYRYYTDELTDFARGRISLEAKLRRGIEQGELIVYYQPQVHIATGRIVGAEALVRWRHPLDGLIGPDQFIPLAEETGLIVPIGEYVLRETCRQGKVWLDGGHRLTLAVNLSAHQLRHQNLVQTVETILKETGFPANRLELELTESTLMQHQEETVATLHALRALGIRLAIDDFGTGYSSLAYLKRFPLDVLKIDKSFVDDLPFDKDDSAITTAIIAMANALGFQVLAEGTERAEQIDFLRAHGCDMYQGYYTSPPVAAAEFEAFLV